MAKIVKKIVKNVINSYFEGWKSLYEPCIKNGVYPFI